jgi:capsular polysaccharide biosynthesis protein
LKRFTAETRRLHPASISAQTWETLRRLPWTEGRERELQEEFELRYGPGEKHPDAGLQAGKRLKSAEEVRWDLGLDPNKPTAAIFSHILWDANLFYGRDLFSDQEEWLVESVRAACENPAVNWIVKLHPANLFKAPGSEPNDKIAIREAIGELPQHVKVVEPGTDINTFSLFSLLQYGVTIRGTIGIELPCFGVPVLTAGTGRYSGFGFTNDSASSGEYLDKLRRIHELPPLSDEETLLAKRHAFALFRLRPLRFSSFRASFRPVHASRDPLNHNLRLSLRTAREVEEAADLRDFARWAQDRSQLDYLAPTPS